jgi:alkyl sulfatase BDS1-like metallo-beta-lactamase superfamily hydrolase
MTPPTLFRSAACLALAVLLAACEPSPPAPPPDGDSVALDPPAGQQAGHFHPKGRTASETTREKQRLQRTTLPFDDEQDFEENRRGFIAAPDYKQIIADAGHVAWDMGRYDFLLDSEGADSMHPSLRRQALLNRAYGLYEVVPGRIYQLRGFDLANMTAIRGDTGWILFDVLTTRETARAALAFLNEQLGERPVVAVVYSHSHADHFGGILGVVDREDVAAGRVQILAPKDFMEHVISENIYAGNAMARRLHYQYGTFLPASPFGHVDQSIGKNVAIGRIGVLPPTRSIEEPLETVVIDGIEMVFQNTPGTEAPSEMNTWFPQFKVFWAAENISGTIHNIYTLRGALIRDALAWSKYINEALYLFGREAEVMITSHNWPRWGNARIQEVMRDQRDTYAHLNNAVLHLANRGVTINEIHNEYRVPESLQRKWHARGYHGSFEHNSRGVLNRYLGYWDANPTTLIPLSPGDSAPLYVEMMGGAEAILERGRELFRDGRYRLAQEILTKLLYAQPDDQANRDLLADVWEQIGYQQESPSVRNSFLAGALELRSGLPEQPGPSVVNADLLTAMTTEMYFDYLAVLVNPEKAEGLRFTINVETPDTGGRYVVEMSNATLTSVAGHQAPDADLTIRAPADAFLRVLLQQTTFTDLAQRGELQMSGNAAVFEQLRATLDPPPPLFEILPGTRGTASAESAAGAPVTADTAGQET